jgi:hypothetical protein
MEQLMNNNNENKTKLQEISKNEFIMPTEDAIGKVIFSTHFMSFIKKIVKCSIIAVYKSFIENSAFKSSTIEGARNIIRDGNIIFETAIKSLNQYWIDYHKNKEENNKNKLDLMKKHGKILHTSCLFSYIWEFCQILLIYTLGRIDISELRDSEFLGDSIDIITDAICAFHVETLNNRDVFCDDNCEVFEYSENDEFIKMKKI